jgi:hypothetical protein
MATDDKINRDASEAETNFLLMAKEATTREQIYTAIRSIGEGIEMLVDTLRPISARILDGNASAEDLTQSTDLQARIARLDEVREELLKRHKDEA